MIKTNFSNRQKGLIAACLTAATWSILAIFLKFGLKYSNSYSIVWYRMFVAFSVLLGWHFFRNKTHELKIFKIKPGLLLIAALCLSFNYVGFMQGVHYASPASAQIFIQFGPLLLALAGLFIFKEKLSKKQLIGFSFCLMGFALFFADRLNVMNENPGSFYIGLAWILAAAVTWAVFASLQKKLLDKWQSTQINIYIYAVASLLYLPVVDWQSLINLPLSIHFFYIFLGLNTILAYGCLSIALKHLPATQVSPIITMNPLLTLILISLIDWMQWTFIPADPIGWKGYLGAIVAIMGVRAVLTKKKAT